MLLPKQIIALKKIVSRITSRFALPAVRIERNEHGPRAIATDGRRAVIFQWDEPEADQFPPVEGMSNARVRQFAANVPAQAFADAGRGISRRTTNPALGHLLLDESDASNVRLAAKGNETITRAQAKAVEGQFPDCDAVLPTPAREKNVYDPGRHGAAAFTHTRIGVNAKQFAQTLTVVSDLAADDPSTTVLMTVPIDPHRPIRLDARCEGRRAAAVVMPVPADSAKYDEPPVPPQAASIPSPRRKRRRLPPPLPATTSVPSTPPADVDHRHVTSVKRQFKGASRGA